MSQENVELAQRVIEELRGHCASTLTVTSSPCVVATQFAPLQSLRAAATRSDHPPGPEQTTTALVEPLGMTTGCEADPHQRTKPAAVTIVHRHGGVTQSAAARQQRRARG